MDLDDDLLFDGANQKPPKAFQLSQLSDRTRALGREIMGCVEVNLLVYVWGESRAGFMRRGALSMLAK